jgi:hypothetical protein
MHGSRWRREETRPVGPARAAQPRRLSPTLLIATSCATCAATPAQTNTTRWGVIRSIFTAPKPSRPEDEVLALYAFPAERWPKLRSTDENGASSSHHSGASSDHRSQVHQANRLRASTSARW